MQCAGSDCLVIRNNNSCAGFIASEDHVTPTLTRENESDTLQRLSKILAG